MATVVRLVRSDGFALKTPRPFRKSSPAQRAAIGLRAHSGWAVLVALGGSVVAPAVIARRRIELIDPAIAGSAQPYHAAQSMKLENAQAFLARCADIARTMARNAVEDSLAELCGQSYDVIGCSVLWASGKSIPDLTRILASHPLIHTAEGEFFREALRSACQSCSLPVQALRERELLARSAAVLGVSPDVIERRVSALGKSIGPPWTRDEKLSSLAAWSILAEPPSP